VTEKTVDQEPVVPTHGYQMQLKPNPWASNLRMRESSFRGFGRVREADGRKGLAFSCVGIFVMSLMGAIYEHPTGLRSIVDFESAATP
jgi:hypothetical protein